MLIGLIAPLRPSLGASDGHEAPTEKPERREAMRREDERQAASYDLS